MKIKPTIRYHISGFASKMQIEIKILVSACLVGCRSRYDGKRLPVTDAILQQWSDRGMVVLFCPETAGGLAVPRPPAEILGGDGKDVLNGKARVCTPTGDDVTTWFTRGAYAAVDAARCLQVNLAILKEGSPSCGSTRIYDGSFSGKSVPGCGVTAALLSRNGVRVFSEGALDAAQRYIAESPTNQPVF